jgi:hypothetical protein
MPYGYCVDWICYSAYHADDLKVLLGGERSTSPSFFQATEYPVHGIGTVYEMKTRKNLPGIFEII